MQARHCFGRQMRVAAYYMCECEGYALYPVYAYILTCRTHPINSRNGAYAPFINTSELCLQIRVDLSKFGKNHQRSYDRQQ